MREELRLPATPIAPMLARAGLTPLTNGLSRIAAADAALLTTEIVANAVRYAPNDALDEILVRISLDEVLRVEVVDSGRPFEPPTANHPRDERASGWGLYLLDQLASAWGIEPEGSGQVVWFELDASRA